MQTAAINPLRTIPNRKWTHAVWECALSTAAQLKVRMAYGAGSSLKRKRVFKSVYGELVGHDAMQFGEITAVLKQHTAPPPRHHQ
jgi:hypothetical protein